MAKTRVTASKKETSFLKVIVGLFILFLSLVAITVTTQLIDRKTQTSSKASTLRTLAVGMPMHDAGFVVSIAQGGDIYSAEPDTAERKLPMITQSSRMLMLGDVVGLEDKLDTLQVPITYVGYDLEGQDPDPVGDVKAAQQIARSHGLKLVIGPTKYYNEKYGEQLAPYTDVYMPQAKSYQANLSPEAYRTTLRALYTKLKNANPNVSIWLDLSPSPKDIPVTAQEMLRCVNAVRDLIDGVWVTHTASEVGVVSEFVNLLSQPAVTPTPTSTPTPRPTATPTPRPTSTPSPRPTSTPTPGQTLCPTCSGAMTLERVKRSNNEYAVRLRWSSAKNVDSFSIYRCFGGGCLPTELVTRDVKGTATSYLDDNDGRNFQTTSIIRYRIRPLRDNCEANFCDTVEIRP